MAVLHAFYEFFKGAKEQAEELGTSWGHEIKYAMIFALQCHGNTKVSTRQKPKTRTLNGIMSVRFPQILYRVLNTG